MKKNLNSLLAAFAIAILATFMYSCAGDKCKDVNCGVHGTCLEGTCNCDAGYEGTQCQTVSRDKTLGNWTVKASCAIDSCGTIVPANADNCPQNYTVSISSATDIQKFKVKNFGNYGQTTEVAGTLSPDNSIVLDSTSIGTTVITKVKGNGTYFPATGTIVLRYTSKTTLPTNPPCNIIVTETDTLRK